MLSLTNKNTNLYVNDAPISSGTSINQILLSQNLKHLVIYIFS